MIWTPEPAPEITEDVPSPNVLVWTPPDVPPPRFELKEAESSRPDEEALQAEAAPEVDTVADAALDLESLQPIQRLRYQAEAAEQQRPVRKLSRPRRHPSWPPPTNPPWTWLSFKNSIRCAFGPPNKSGRPPKSRRCGRGQRHRSAVTLQTA